MKIPALLLAVFAVAVASLVLSTPAVQAQDYPQQRIRLITPFPFGGVTDVLSRIISEQMALQFGQPVIVDNRPGAGGMNGTEIAARAAPDGYTLVNVISSHSVQNYLYKKVPYDYVKDFEPVIPYARSALVFGVHPSVPAINRCQIDPARNRERNIGRMQQQADPPLVESQSSPALRDIGGES